MRKLIAATILFLVLATPAMASPKPVDYGRTDPFLAAYMNTLPSTEARVQAALNITKAMYPDWFAEYYQENEFDCSEMAAYVQYFFARCGISSVYCVNPFWNHAWLEVPDGEGWLIVEPTSLVIQPEIVRFWYYKGIVFRAFELPESELDWWDTL